MYRFIDSRSSSRTVLSLLSFLPALLPGSLTGYLAGLAIYLVVLSVYYSWTCLIAKPMSYFLILSQTVSIPISRLTLSGSDGVPCLLAVPSACLENTWMIQ